MNCGTHGGAMRMRTSECGWIAIHWRTSGQRSWMISPGNALPISTTAEVAASRRINEYRRGWPAPDGGRSFASFPELMPVAAFGLGTRPGKRSFSWAKFCAQPPQSPENVPPGENAPAS